MSQQDSPTDATREEATSADAPEPPRLEGAPVVGNTLELVRDPFGFYDRLDSRGDAVRYRIMGRECCTVFEPEYVERILVGQNERYEKAELFRDAAAGFAERGLLVTEGEVWRDQRTRIQPAFTPDRIRGYADAMVRYAERTLDDLEDGEVVDVADVMSELTLEILAKSLFDVDVEGRRAVVREAAAALNDRGDAGGASAFLPDWVPTPSNRRFERAMADFESMVDDLIAERRDDESEFDDLLSLLLRAEGPDGSAMSEPVVRDQLVTFLFAGHETTALALTYAWHLLARNPEQRERLEAELDAQLGDDPATTADPPALEYTESVVHETLRLYPPAYVLFREPTENVRVGPYRLREGTTITIPVFKLHRDGRFYDAPDEFRPERWGSEPPSGSNRSGRSPRTGDAADDRPEYAYLPFGGGPRHCIGMRFALTELKLVLATLAREVAFEPTYEGDPDLTMAATLRPDRPMEMRVRKSE